MMYPLVDVSLASGPFETQTKYTAIAMAVKIPGAIADEVSPRLEAPFKFTYTRLREDDQLTPRESRASRAGRVNEIEFGANDVLGEVEDFALACAVPDRDIREAKSQGSPYDPLAVATDGLTQIMSLNREIRVAKMLTDESNYATGYKATLAGNTQWSNAASDPLAAVLEAMDRPLVRPNTFIIGQEAWTKFRQHPKIVAAVKPSASGKEASGAASRRAVADLLEVDVVSVGRVQYQTANLGQDDAFAYVWGKHAALLHINRSLSGMSSAVMPSFSFTAEAMGRMVGSYREPGRGVGQGSTIVKVSECIKELVSWVRAGHLFRNAVA